MDFAEIAREAAQAATPELKLVLALAALLGENEHGWFETAAGEALNINLSGAIPVGGHISYIEYDPNA